MSLKVGSSLLCVTNKNKDKYLSEQSFVEYRKLLKVSTISYRALDYQHLISETLITFFDKLLNTQNDVYCECFIKDGLTFEKMIIVQQSDKFKPLEISKVLTPPERNHVYKATYRELKNRGIRDLRKFSTRIKI